MGLTQGKKATRRNVGILCDETIQPLETLKQQIEMVRKVHKL